MKEGRTNNPLLERELLEFALSRGANISPSELKNMSNSKVFRLFLMLREVQKREEEEIRKASKKPHN